jgi:hypothetical protein
LTVRNPTASPYRLFVAVDSSPFSLTVIVQRRIKKKRPQEGWHQGVDYGTLTILDLDRLRCFGE